MIKKVVKVFDRIESKIRGKLSEYPMMYALVGGIGIILFWRGIWHLADDLSISGGIRDITSSTLSVVIGAVIMLLTGIFVSAFIGDRLIISGLIGEKKLEEESKDEIDTEETQIKNLQNTLSRLEKKLDHIDQDIEAKK